MKRTKSKSLVNTNNAHFNFPSKSQHQNKLPLGKMHFVSLSETTLLVNQKHRNRSFRKF